MRETSIGTSRRVLIDVDHARWCTPTDRLSARYSSRVSRRVSIALAGVVGVCLDVILHSSTRECEANGFVCLVEQDDDDDGTDDATRPWVIFVRRSRSVRGTWA